MSYFPYGPYGPYGVSDFQCSPSNGTAFPGIAKTTLQQWLTDAQTAYQLLLTGGKPVSVSYSQGDAAQAVTFAAADIGKLGEYIQLLQKELGLGRRRRAMGVRY